ncbi:anti-sigma factor [Flavobacterium sp.]|uniref:anti-sigma factor n=1 Tax=Flavobacterium sp. TaxID=239 RepID=UPI0040471A51
MKKNFFSILALGLLMASCNNDDDAVTASPSLKLNLTGLEDLGPDYKYEGWIIVNGAPVSTGVFTVDGSGVLSKTTFDVDATNLAAATKFVLSIEPTVDPSPAPSDTKYLVGDFTGNSATVSSGIVGDFSASTGKYLLATPTNGNMNPEAGIWFIDNTSGTGMAGLNLPTLDSGWKYEGWVVSNGVVLSTGKFSAVDASDEAAPYSGTMMAPPFPGEDFLMNAPTGLTFPGNLSGSTIVISVEPSPDNSTMPFAMKPLVHTVANPAVTGNVIDMNSNLASLPSGTVTR